MRYWLRFGVQVSANAREVTSDTLIVIASAHADAAMIALALLVACTLAIAWRAPAATGAIAAALGHCPYQEVIHRDNMVVTA